MREESSPARLAIHSVSLLRSVLVPKTKPLLIHQEGSTLREGLLGCFTSVAVGLAFDGRTSTARASVRDVSVAWVARRPAFCQAIDRIGVLINLFPFCKISASIQQEMKLSKSVWESSCLSDV